MSLKAGLLDVERLVGVLSQTQFSRLPESLVGRRVLIGKDPSWRFPF